MANHEGQCKKNMQLCDRVKEMNQNDETKENYQKTL